MRRGSQEEPKRTGDICPISGGEILWVGYDYGTMDGDHYYVSSTDPKITYTKNSRSRYYELTSGPTKSSASKSYDGKRYFKKDDDGKWVEYFLVRTHGFPAMFPVGTPDSEVEDFLKKDKEEYLERKRIYEEKVASGEIVPMPVSKVVFSTIPSEKVTVQPLPPPNSSLFYIDTSINDKQI